MRPLRVLKCSYARTLPLDRTTNLFRAVSGYKHVSQLKELPISSGDHRRQKFHVRVSGFLKKRGGEKAKIKRAKNAAGAITGRVIVSLVGAELRCTF